MDDGGRTNDRFSCLTDDAARPLRPTAEELGAVQNKNKSNDFKSAVF